jgi:hypothetical protein
VIAEPLALEDRPQLETAAAPRPNTEPAASEASAERQAAPLTMARVTASLQLILAARRAARIANS